MAKILLYLAMAISLALVQGNPLEIPEDYLPRARLHGPADYLHSIEVLAEVKLNGATSPEEVAERLRESLKTLADEADRMEIQVWLELTTPDDNCNDYLANFFINRYANVKQSSVIENKQAFIDFMLMYGRQKFDKCARKALETIKSKSKGNQELTKAELFFKKLVFLNENDPDSDLYRELKQRNVDDADWNVDYLASFFPHARDPQFKRQRFESLFIDYCEVIEEDFRAALDVINMATVLNSGTDYLKDNFNAMKINEMARICLDLWRSNSSFGLNLIRQMGTPEVRQS